MCQIANRGGALSATPKMRFDLLIHMAAKESDVIEAAHEDLLRQLFSTFYLSYTSAMGEESQEADAEKIFARGVAHARFIRDRAISLLP